MNPSLEIRPGMDVFTSSGSHFIGSVVRVWRGEHRPRDGARGEEKESAVEDTPIVHEEGHVETHAAMQGRRMSGEDMGPVPTRRSGNEGPATQSAGRDYATGERPDAQGGVVSFAVRPGRYSLGPLTRSIYVPTSAVRSISMERVILGIDGDAIPEEWRNTGASATS